ncbi:MAG: hypothetical protein JJ908_05895 [Rhizobiales bacterium]|nr:hypothetical protein [Hyphomicrobiales bacterium]MBO6697862.1 hypothetical protein [Hyphomicrobiales bacterium]MBO6735884.1 hypothetical protein [Hyphomicrobiales bacterium]MBO6913895.1 hypothetical protein [Hyphomicrobiales bacterium]MBO6955598.1 hypothetical protein [Hyphomicrobiales bacterium]
MAEADDDPILEPRPARPWYVQAIDTLNKRSSSLSHAEPNFPKEKSLDDSRLGQMATYERELFDRATVKWWPSRAEREALKLVKNQSAQVRGYYEERIIQRRMDYLREKDRQAYWRSIQPDVTPTLRERMACFLKRRVLEERER